LSWTTERARVASLTRSRNIDDPELVAARSALKVERFTDRAQKLAAEAPSLTVEQRDAILAAFAGLTVRGAHE